MNRKLIAVIVLVVLVIGGWGLTRLLRGRKQADSPAEAQQATVPVQIYRAQKGDIQSSFSATGTIEAEIDINVVPKMSGKVARVYVDEGDVVTAGQLLAVLEHQDLRSQLSQARAAADGARARLKQAQTGVGLQQAQTDTTFAQAGAQLKAAQSRLQQAQTTAEIAVTQTTTSLDQAVQALDQAQARLDMLRQGARRQEREQAEEAVRQAQARQENARKNLERAERLLSQGAIAQQQYDAAQLQYDIAVTNYNTAVQRRDLTEEGARSEEIRIAEAQVQQAQSALVLAQANQAQKEIRQRDVEAAEQQVEQAHATLEMAQAAQARNDISREDVEAAQAALSQAEANIEYLQAQIGYAHIRAPANGVIAQRNIDSGESAPTSSPAFRIVNNDNVYVRATVGERNISEVSKEQKVKVTVDALGGTEFVGTVSQILPVADPGSRAFDIKVHLPNPEGELTAGMFARVQIITQRLTDMLVIPREAIIEQDNKTFVYVAEGNQASRQPVELGLRDETRVAVLSGLKAGDRVIIRGQQQLQPGQAVEVKASGVSPEQ